MQPKIGIIKLLFLFTYAYQKWMLFCIKNWVLQVRGRNTAFLFLIFVFLSSTETAVAPQLGYRHSEFLGTWPQLSSGMCWLLMCCNKKSWVAWKRSKNCKAPQSVFCLNTIFKKMRISVSQILPLRGSEVYLRLCGFLQLGSQVQYLHLIAVFFVPLQE